MITLQSNKKETAISKFFQVDIISLKDFVTKHLVLMIFYNGAISGGRNILFSRKCCNFAQNIVTRRLDNI